MRPAPEARVIHLRDIFGVAPSHELDAVMSSTGRSNFWVERWVHEEFDSGRRLLARYECWVAPDRASDAMTFTWRKLDPAGGELDRETMAIARDYLLEE